MRSKVPSDSRVLVVEDNPADQHLTTVYLGEAWPSAGGSHVDYAADGREALAKLQQTIYSLLILDWFLPDAQNGEVLTHVRQGTTPLPVVVVSGAARSQVAGNLEELRAEFLSKTHMNGHTLHHAIQAAHHRLGLPVPGRFSRSA